MEAAPVWDDVNDLILDPLENFTSALVGLLLALFSYIILYTINPRLIKGEPITFPAVEPGEFEYTPPAEDSGLPSNVTPGSDDYKGWGD